MNEGHRKFLNALKESGTTNMFGATQHLMLAFGVGKQKAKAILIEWMTTYGDEEPDEEEDK